MRIATIVLLLAGCGQVKGQQPDSGADDAATDGTTGDSPVVDGPPVDGSFVTCTEAFDAATLNTGLWRLSDVDNTPIVLSQTGGRLRSTVPTTPNTSTAGTNMAISRNPFAFAESTVQLQVITLPTDFETQSFFYVSDGTNTVGFSLYGNTSFHVSAGTVMANVGTNDRSWRIREAAGTTYIESSSDGNTWSTRVMGATPQLINPSIRIGSFLDTGPGGLYEVDNLVVRVTGSCPL